MTTTNAAADDDIRVGSLLRTWRERRRLSQLDLSQMAEVSTRHLSFVETGRSRPTAEMILRLADHLDVPLRERDRLLLAGGFAPRYDRQGLEPESLGVVMAGLRDLLDAHLPYPALLLDDYWDVIDTNDAVDQLLASCHPSILEPPVNALRISLDPRGLAPRIRNLDQWADHLVRQVSARAQHTFDSRLRELVEELNALAPRTVAQLRPSGPVLAMELETADGLMRFFSVAAQIETPTDSLVAGLHLETFLPADEATRVRLSR